jgi:hypothetical protein
MVARVRSLLVLDRWSVTAFLVSLTVGMVGLSLAGRTAAGVNHFGGFIRLHRYISPESFFFPTASEIVALARATAAPDQTLVIVGGNSIVHGAGQGARELWTGELERMLGERFRVLNLALPAGVIGEHGAIAAEAMLKEGRSVILVAPVFPVGAMAAEGRTYSYVTWDAEAKGLRLPSTERDAALAQPSPVGPDADATRKELRHRSALDGVLYFTDLWHAVAYHAVFTLWQPFVPPGRSFWAPRAATDDPLQMMDPGSAYPAAADDRSMGQTVELLRTWCDEVGDGRWAIKDDSRLWGETMATLRAAVSPGLRERTILLVTLRSPHYTKRLPEAAQQCMLAHNADVVSRLEAEGYPTILMGQDWTDEDYVDSIHPSASGGRKLAAAVAGVIHAAFPETEVAAGAR